MSDPVRTAPIDDARHWVEAVGDRTLFLLGAGASMPSVPGSKELTTLVIRELDEYFQNWAGGDQSPLDRLWADVKPVLEAASASGDIEYLYSVLETLSYRKVDPTAKFVERFKPFVRYQGSHDDLEKHARRLGDMFRDTACGVIAKRSQGAPSGFLLPMIHAPKVGIATLNYDLLVETAAREAGVSLDTGAARWNGGFQWEFDPASVPLLKLHGSLNWRASRVEQAQSRQHLRRSLLYEVEHPGDAAPNGLLDKHVIFGRSAKTTPYSAFPVMLRQFHDWLERAELLVTVGYSFRDQHIDAAIVRWAAGDSSRRIVIIDPSPRRTSIEFGRNEDLLVSGDDLEHLQWALDPDCCEQSPANALESRRLVFVELGADEALSALLS